MLADLKQHYSQNTKYSFTNGQYLALCLYMLEKHTHFTGDGIWSSGHDVKQQSLSSLEKINVAEGINNNTVQSIDNYLNSENSHDINDNFNIKDNNDMDDHDDLNDEDKKSMIKWQHT